MSDDTSAVMTEEKEAAAMVSKPDTATPETKAPAVAQAPVEQKQLDEKLEEMLDSDKVEL